tara:strand:- start:5703 stop:6290 length:588 start_codon:yes stop_codon:yes gene_type:complete
MGNIDHIDLQQLFESTKITNFIETGTCDGLGVKYALTLPIDKIISIEIEPKLYEMCCETFKDENKVQLYCGHSPDILLDILPVKGKTLWWLDAHFPGVDTDILNKTIQSTSNKEERCPLENELRAIFKCGGYEQDYFVIDDLRVYEDGPFKSGNWEERSLYGRDGIDFIYEMFEDTHTIKKSYADNGYILLLPKT